MFTLDESLLLSNLPGALSSETVLVQAWLREHGARFKGFDFNVRVGDGQEPSSTMPEPWRSNIGIGRLQQTRCIRSSVRYDN